MSTDVKNTSPEEKKTITPEVKPETIAVRARTSRTSKSRLSSPSSRSSNRVYYLRREASPAPSSRQNEKEAGLDSKQFNQIIKSSDNPRLVWMKQVLDQTVRYQVRVFKGYVPRKSDLAIGSTVASKQNTDKNRFDDIPCLDNCRVILRNHTTDYIHANYLTLRCRMKFICTQAPMDNTVDDFWHMVIQEKSRLIIMLCNFREDGREKSYQYCPTEVGTKTTIGKTAITTMKRIVHEEGYIESSMDVEYESKTYEIRHLQFTAWPDHSVPPDTEAVLTVFRELLREQPKTPIVIHCSAGVGRTCTFVGSLMLLERILERDNPSGLAVVKEMRQNRFGAVQRSTQFVFMHYVLLEMFCQDGIMSTNDPQMCSYRKKFEKLVRKSECRRVGKEISSEVQLTSEIK